MYSKIYDETHDECTNIEGHSHDSLAIDDWSVILINL